MEILRNQVEATVYRIFICYSDNVHTEFNVIHIRYLGRPNGVLLLRLSVLQ